MIDTNKNSSEENQHWKNMKVILLPLQEHAVHIFTAF